MIDFHAAQARSHRRNIERYCRLLATELTDLERQYLIGRESGKARSRYGREGCGVGRGNLTFPQVQRYEDTRGPLLFGSWVENRPTAAWHAGQDERSNRAVASTNKGRKKESPA